jgi:hypothetical protein
LHTRSCTGARQPGSPGKLPGEPEGQPPSGKLATLMGDTSLTTTRFKPGSGSPRRQGRPVQEWWQKATPSEHTKRPRFAGVDDDRILRLPVADERDDALLASTRPLHGAVVTADRERRHATMIAGGCDTSLAVRISARAVHCRCGRSREGASAPEAGTSPEDRQQLSHGDDVRARPADLAANPAVVCGHDDGLQDVEPVDQFDDHFIGLYLGG